MKKQYTYDFVLSFAGEDREVVGEVKRFLEQNHFKVFYDFDEQEVLLGKDLADYFSELYQEEGKYCAMFISKYYIRKPWTRWERRAALARALKSRKEYILPYFLDDSRLSSIPETIGRAKFPDVSPKEFARLLIKKYYRESNCLEIMDGIFIKNVETAKTLTTYKEGYVADIPMRFRDEEPWRGYERGARFNFSIVNTTDQRLDIGNSCLRAEDKLLPCGWGRESHLILLNQLCEPTGGLIYSSVEPHEVKNFGFKICSLCWEENEDYEPDIFKKFGPPKVLSIFPEKIEYSENALEDVLESLRGNNFEIFNCVKFEVCMELELAGKCSPICVKTILYENQARFVNIRKERNGV